MRVIFMEIPTGQGGPSSVEMEALHVESCYPSVWFGAGGGGPPVGLGVRLLHEYLVFLAGRCRPNTVLAVAYDLKVFFTVAAKAQRGFAGPLPPTQRA